MKNFKALCKVYFADAKTRLSFGLSLLAVAGLFLITSLHSEPMPKPEVGLGGPDDFIPVGFSLLPLDLQNREALNALVGGFAFVDLFTVSSDGKGKGVAVARRVKLVRSPANPEYFAALIAEEQVGPLLAHPGPFVAAIQSKLGTNAAHLSRSPPSHSRVRIYPEDKK